jgi:Ca2+-transporting ATPase
MSTHRSATTVRTGPTPAAGTRDGEWYARPPDDVARALAVDPAVGLSAAAVSEQLRVHGPNALPEEKPRPGWLRFRIGVWAGSRPSTRCCSSTP